MKTVKHTLAVAAAMIGATVLTLVNMLELTYMMVAANL